jgi:hypothetical protein
MTSVLFVGLLLEFCARSGIASASSAPIQAFAEERSSSVAREIDDPRARIRWQVLKNGDNPGGPGRLLPVAKIFADCDVRQPNQIAAPGMRTATARPVIRAGDALIIEDDSNAARIRLEAVAMMPAAAGAVFKVRLKFGNAQVNAIALTAGRAKLAPLLEVQP